MIDKYIEMRNSGKYDIQWFYDYYISHSKDTIDIHNFAMTFNLINLDNVLAHIDRKFELTRIYDENNNFLMVYK